MKVYVLHVCRLEVEDMSDPISEVLAVYSNRSAAEKAEKEHGANPQLPESDFGYSTKITEKEVIDS